MSSLTQLQSEKAKQAAAYERLAVPALFAGWASSLVDLACPASGARIVDVGCGTGIVARTLAARLGPEASITAIDNDPAMLAVAQAAAEPTAAIQWREGDAQRLPFDEATFDVAFSQQALQFLDDPGGALRELQRVVRPGGLVALDTWRGVRDAKAAQVLGTTLARHLSPEAAGELDAPCVFGTPEILARSVSDAGLQVLHADVLVQELDFGSADEFLELAALLTSLGPWLERVAGDARRRLSDDLDRALGDPPLPGSHRGLRRDRTPMTPEPATMLSRGALPDAVSDAVQRLADSEQSVSAFVYRPEVAAARAARLRQALPSWAEVFYAVKANAFPPVLRALAGVVEGFEVASQLEAELASAVAGSRPRLVASGPGKSDANLRRLVELGAEVVNAESMLELRRLAHIARGLAAPVRVTLRVSPKPVRISPQIVLGRDTTQFGIDEDQISSVLAAAAELGGIEVVGFHFHLVCNNLDAAAHAAFVRWCLEWSQRTAAAHAVDLQLVDVGGGLGVPGPGQEELDLGILAESLSALRPPPGTRVIFEPGRWLVDECGYYAAEVTDLKHTNGIWFAVLRGGIHHFLRPAVYGTRHEFTVVARNEWPYAFPRPEVREAPVTVVGELCTPADVLARDVLVERLRPGDIVVFPRAGSYGWEMSVHEFLAHPRAERVVAPVQAGTLPSNGGELDERLQHLAHVVDGLSLAVRLCELGRLDERAHDRVLHDAVVEGGNHRCPDRSVLLHHRGVERVRLDPHHLRASGELLRRGVDHRKQRRARVAGRSVEVHEHRHRRLEHLDLEVLRADHVANRSHLPVEHVHQVVGIRQPADQVLGASIAEGDDGRQPRHAVARRELVRPGLGDVLAEIDHEHGAAAVELLRDLIQDRKELLTGLAELRREGDERGARALEHPLSEVPIGDLHTGHAQLLPSDSAAGKHPTRECADQPCEWMWYQQAVAGEASSRTPAITVRAGQLDDVGVIADLHFRSAEAGFSTFVPPDRPVPTRTELADDWTARMTVDPGLGRVAFVAEHDGSIVGVLEAGREPFDHTLGRVARCYIDPGVWGARVGSQLFGAGISHLRELGCTAVHGWAMEHNRRSQERVEHLGMRPTGKRQPSCEPAVPAGIEDVEYWMPL